MFIFQYLFYIYFINYFWMKKPPDDMRTGGFFEIHKKDNKK